MMDLYEVISMAKKSKHEGHTKEVARGEMKDVVGCLSCGMPNKRTQREVASEIADYCPSCVDQHGHLRSYEEVFERLVTRHFMGEEGMSRVDAEKAARVKLAEMPAWKDQPQ